MGNQPNSFLPQSKFERQVAGLRDAMPPTECKVFDAETYILKRVIPPEEIVIFTERNVYARQTNDS